MLTEKMMYASLNMPMPASSTSGASSEHDQRSASTNSPTVIQVVHGMALSCRERAWYQEPKHEEECPARRQQDIQWLTMGAVSACMQGAGEGHPSRPSTGQ